MPAVLPRTEGPGSAAGSAYLGGLPQHPLGHCRPVGLGYLLQRGQGSRHVSRGDVVPCRLRDELKAQWHQKAFLHLSVHATLLTTSRRAQEHGEVSTGHCLSWSSLFPVLLPSHALEHPCVSQLPVPHVGGLILPNKPISWSSPQGSVAEPPVACPRERWKPKTLRDGSQRHRFKKNPLINWNSKMGWGTCRLLKQKSWKTQQGH